MSPEPSSTIGIVSPCSLANSRARDAARAERDADHGEVVGVGLLRDVRDGVCRRTCLGHVGIEEEDEGALAEQIARGEGLAVERDALEGRERRFAPRAAAGGVVGVAGAALRRRGRGSRARRLRSRDLRRLGLRRVSLSPQASGTASARATSTARRPGGTAHG